MGYTAVAVCLNNCPEPTVQYSKVAAICFHCISFFGCTVMSMWQCIHTRSISPRILNSQFSLRMHARNLAKLWLKQKITSSKSCTLLFRVWQGWCWRSWFGRMTGPPQLPASIQLFTAPMGQFYNLFFVSSYIKTSYSVLGTCATFSCTAPVVRTLKGGARVMVGKKKWRGGSGAKKRR